MTMNKMNWQLISSVNGVVYGPYNPRQYLFSNEIDETAHTIVDRFGFAHVTIYYPNGQKKTQFKKRFYNPNDLITEISKENGE